MSQYPVKAPEGPWTFRFPKCQGWLLEESSNMRCSDPLPGALWGHPKSRTLKSPESNAPMVYVASQVAQKDGPLYLKIARI